MLRHLETHRAGYAPHVQQAMALLDRVSVGDEVSDESIEMALLLTGDLGGKCPEMVRSQNLTGGKNQ